MRFFEVKWGGRQRYSKSSAVKRPHHNQLMEDLGEELMVQNTMSKRVEDDLRERKCEG